MTPHITQAHPLEVRCDLRASSLTSSQLFPASGCEEVELMTVPLVAPAPAPAPATPAPLAAPPTSSQEVASESNPVSTVLLENSSGSLHLLRVSSGCHGNCSLILRGMKYR